MLNRKPSRQLWSTFVVFLLCVNPDRIEASFPSAMNLGGRVWGKRVMAWGGGQREVKA